MAEGHRRDGLLDDAALEVSAVVGTGTAAWLDLCCGSGRALIQAARQLGRAALTGVDLVDAFDATSALTTAPAPATPGSPAVRSYCAENS